MRCGECDLTCGEFRICDWITHVQTMSLVWPMPPHTEDVLNDDSQCIDSWEYMIVHFCMNALENRIVIPIVVYTVFHCLYIQENFTQPNAVQLKHQAQSLSPSIHTTFPPNLLIGSQSLP